MATPDKEKRPEPQQTGPGGGGPASEEGSKGRAQVKQDLVGKSYDAQAARLAPVDDAGNAKLRKEIADAAKKGGDDDYVRDTITAAHLKIATAVDKAGMITNLLDGDTGDEDEAKILMILRSSNGTDVLRAIESMGNSQWLLDDVNGEEGDQLQALTAKLKKDEVTLAEKKKAAKAAEAKPKEPEPKAEPPAEVAKDLREDVKKGDAAAAEPKRITDPNDPAMSDARKKMIYEGERRMESRPSSYSKDGKSYVGSAPKNGHEKATNLFDGATKTKDGATSCGLLPGVLMRQFAVLKNGKAAKITKWLTSNGKDQDGLEKFGLEFGCWTYQSGRDMPQPGDVIVTNFPDTGAFAHVCVAHTISDRTWITMDSGQGRELGDSAQKVTKNILTDDERVAQKLGPGLYQGNSGDQAGGNTTQRKVHGWIDIDKLVAYASG